MKMKWFSTTHLENEELSENYLIFSTIEVLGWIHSKKDIFTIVANMGNCCVMNSPAVVGSAVPIAVLAVPVRVLAVHWVRGPWGL